MNINTAMKYVAASRFAIGAMAWIRPDWAARGFGIRQPGNNESRYLWRLFGIRDAVIGLATVTADDHALGGWLAVGVACDAADGLAAIAGQRAGHLPRSTAPLYVVPAVAVAMGAAALWRSGAGTDGARG